MPFLHPLGLIALLSVPAVLLLHLFRRRFRTEVVSALFLWSEAREVAAAGRRRERLLTSPSFWFELAAAAALGLAFAGPKACDGSTATHLVCVLDDSASMSSRAGDETLRERAATVLEERLDAIGSSGRTTLVVTGSRPRVLAGPGALVAEARRALESWSPSAGRHDLAPAVALAQKVAAGGAVTLFTDRFEPERYPEDVEVVAVGEPLANAALVRARRGPDGDDTERIELTVARTGPGEEATVVLHLRAGDELLAERTLPLRTGDRKELAFTLPRSDRVLEARIAVGGGALEVDDVVDLAPPPPRTVALATTLDAETLARLGLGPDAERWLALVDDSVTADPALAHATLGAAPSALVSLELVAEGEDRRDWIGPFLIERRHPLLDGVTLDGVIWSAQADRTLPGSPLVSAGNAPLLTEERVGTRRVFRANLDPKRSTLARSPDWPILLANLAELARRELPGPERTNLAVGEAFVYRAREEATWVLTGPDALERELFAREVVVIEDLDRPGVYELASENGERARFALAFLDPAESDLGALSTGERRSSLDLAALTAASSPAARALLLAALAFVLLDWWILGRGRSRAAA